MRSLAFFNNKGGVGKTSLVYHLAWMYASRGVSEANALEQRTGGDRTRVPDKQRLAGDRAVDGRVDHAQQIVTWMNM